MLLVITNKEDYTADHVILELHERGIPFARFNTEDFPQQVFIRWRFDGADVTGHIRWDSRKVALEEIDVVWLRRPKPPEPSGKLPVRGRDFAMRESAAALAGVWRSLKCRWVNHPDHLARARYKLRQLQVAANLGFRIPRTLVTNDPNELPAFFEENEGQVVAKTIRSPFVAREAQSGIIYTEELTREHLKSRDLIQFSPVIFQEHVRKKMDIRITVIGDHVFATEIHSQQILESRVDWRRGDTESIPHRVHELPPDIIERIRNFLSYYGLAFAAIDMVQDVEGEYVFLEVNPNGQWAWIEGITHQPMRKAMVDLLTGSGPEWEGKLRGDS